MNIIDVTYERACMATTKDKYFEKMLENLIDHNDCHNTTLSNEKIIHAVSKFLAETEEEECNANNMTTEECNANNMTMDTYCQYPIMNNTQRKDANVPNERRISSDILAETIKRFNRYTLCSTINDSGYYNSNEDDAESDPKIKEKKSH